MPEIKLAHGRMDATRAYTTTLTLLIFAIFLTGKAGAGDAVSIESKWVESGATDVQLGVFITNSKPICATLLTLEIRSIHVGSFIRRSLDIRPQGRIAAWAGEDATTVENYYPFRSTPSPYPRNRCPTDSEGKVWAWMEHDSLPDFMGEEALLYYFSTASGGTPTLAAGADAEAGSGTPSFLLVFDVTEEGGAFEIDTTCTAPANHICFVDEDVNLVIPTFERGIVLIGCDAECHADPNCDGQSNIIDLVKSIDVAFKNAPPVIDPDPRCPVENTDVNCDLMTNVLDIVRMVNVQYRMSAMSSEFCEPCNHVPRTGRPKDDVRTPYFRGNGS